VLGATEIAKLAVKELETKVASLKDYIKKPN